MKKLSELFTLALVLVLLGLMAYSSCTKPKPQIFSTPTILTSTQDSVVTDTLVSDSIK
jgi:uncharacterized lipoprotein YajG